MKAEAKFQLFEKESNTLLEKTQTSSFEFVAELKSSFEHINQAQLKKYAISNEEIEKIRRITKEAKKKSSDRSVGRGASGRTTNR